MPEFPPPERPQPGPAESDTGRTNRHRADGPRRSGGATLAAALGVLAGVTLFAVTLVSFGSKDSSHRATRGGEVAPTADTWSVPTPDVSGGTDAPTATATGETSGTSGTSLTPSATSDGATQAQVAKLNDHPYSLSVVYFVPSDRQVLPRYRERLSEILVQGREFLRQQMAGYGFSNNVLGLHYEPDGLVSISVVKGKHPASSYPYNGGHGVIGPEVEAYLKAHPQERRSEHVLVIVPIPYSGSGEMKADTPFYGVGRWSYVLDYPQMEKKYLTDSGPLGQLAVPWIGGLMHEMGHALNLPHDRSTTRDQAAAGESLMGTGNWTYGRSPTRLTHPDAAILNTSQVFQVQPVKDLYQPRSASVRRLRVRFRDGVVEIRGHLSTAPDVQRVIAYLDPEGGADYDRVGWVTTLDGSKLALDLPVKQLPQQNGKYQLQFLLTHANGSMATLPTVKFSIRSGVADVRYFWPR